MSVIPYQKVSLPSSGEFDRVRVIKWSGLTTSDSGQPISRVNFADRSVKVGGTFGGGTVHIEGYIGDPADVETAPDSDWLSLTDPSDNFLDITEAKIEAISQVALYIRPRVSGGSGVNVDVYLLVKE